MYILEKNKIRDYLLYIFIEDYEKAQNFFKDILKLKNSKIISCEIIDDFKLMNSSVRFIIAKSTSSWYAGFFLIRKSKIHLFVGQNNLSFQILKN